MRSDIFKGWGTVATRTIKYTLYCDRIEFYNYCLSSCNHNDKVCNEIYI